MNINLKNDLKTTSGRLTKETEFEQERMVEAILLDQNRIFPVCAHIDGEYGIDDLYIGVPVKLGKGGIKEVIRVELTKKESELLQESAKAVRGTLDDFKALMNNK